MHNNIEKIKKQMQLFTPNEQIVRINHEIDRIEKINIRTGSIDRINQKYATLNQLKTMKNKLITEESNKNNFPLPHNNYVLKFKD